MAFQVYVALEMEHTSQPMRVQLSEQSHHLITEHFPNFVTVERGVHHVKVRIRIMWHLQKNTAVHLLHSAFHSVFRTEVSVVRFGLSETETTPD